MPVIGYEGLYQVSNMGNVRSLDREITDRSGCVRILKGRVRKQVMTRGGYLMVGLCKECKGKWFKVHRLVWMAFNGIIPDGMQINHIDEDKTNNKLENLNLMTCKENNNWGTRNERNRKARINHPSMSKQVVAFDEDDNVVFEFPSAKEAGRQGFDQSHLSACCRGEQRTHRGYRWKYKEDIEKT